MASDSDTQHEIVLMRARRALYAVIDTLDSASSNAARTQKLHPTDFACIAYLVQMGVPVSPKAIAAHLKLMSSGSATALLDRLERAGYTRRVENPDDRRSVLIELDQERAAEPLRHLAEIEQTYRQIAGTFTSEDLETVSRFLEAMTQIARKLSQ